MLLLRRPPEQEAALDRFIDALHDPASPHYHHWLDAARVGTEYGPAVSDIAKIADWLGRHGFRVNFVYPDRMVIDFSGTAGKVRAAFHAPLHRLEADGERHVANLSDPRIPAALAPAIAGVVAMNDFAAHTEHEFDPDYPVACKPSRLTGTCDTILPADLATIYDLNPLFAAGVTGKGQTVAVIETSNPVNIEDWAVFRRRYGLAAYHGGKVAVVHPQPPGWPRNCANPGVGKAKDEAILDTEWASAAAPDAHIVLASCANSGAQDGLLTAVLNLVEGSAETRPQIISISYGECEPATGAAHNAAYKSAYQTAVAGGALVFVSAGDELSPACTKKKSPATAFGLAVNGHASTPYNVAVGGTDFSDAFHHETARYWTSSNSAGSGSAKSYVPEIPWNGSCASGLVADYLGFAESYGANGLCSADASKSSARPGVGRRRRRERLRQGCAVIGQNRQRQLRRVPEAVVADRRARLGERRAQPARHRNLCADAPWGHSYVICNTHQGGCAAGHSGTSFSAPIMAGIQALANQKMKATRGEGNPNFAYYRLAAIQYQSASRRAACNATRGDAVAKSCVFHDITEGDDSRPAMPKARTVFCRSAPTGFGPHSATGCCRDHQPPITPLFRRRRVNFATGLGSVDATIS